MLRCIVQGLLNLIDNGKGDGGTLVVPRFHRHFGAWVRSRGTSRGPLGLHSWAHAHTTGVAQGRIVDCAMGSTPGSTLVHQGENTLGSTLGGEYTRGTRIQ